MAGGSVYRFGPFELDAPGARLFRGASRVPLSESQFAILLHLISHAGRVVSKDALVSAAWRGVAVTDNSLDQAISRLRKTLGRGSEHARYIETIPNRGYRFAAEIGRSHRHDAEGSPDLPLAPFRALVQGEDDLDTLDREAIARARRRFEDVLRAEPDYAPAHVGLANACAYAFESTRADIAPDVEALETALAHAAKGCRLAPASAEAWSTHAFVLCLDGRSDDAEAAACKAVALDGADWRHAMRLAYVSWGEARLRAARRVLTLCPGVALAHYLMATVFVARQAFEAALELLQDGCAAQDAQSNITGYPAVALHLHRARVLAVAGSMDAAIDELHRELDAPHRGHVYARECTANTWYTLGALRRRQGRREAAASAFEEALKAMPGHLFAAAALGRDAAMPPRRRDPHTIDLAMARAVGLEIPAAIARPRRHAGRRSPRRRLAAPAGCCRPSRRSIPLRFPISGAPRWRCSAIAPSDDPSDLFRSAVRTPPPPRRDDARRGGQS